MQNIFLLFILIAVTTSAPVDDVKILKYDNTIDELGSYIYNVQTSDGTQKREEGVFLKSDDPEGGVMRVVGFFTYLGPDGVQYTVKYVADENGFRPEGAHLPKVPDDQLHVQEDGLSQKPTIDIRFNDRRGI